MVDVGLIVLLGVIGVLVHLEIELSAHCYSLYLILMLVMVVVVHLTVFDGEDVVFVLGVHEDIEDCLLVGRYVVILDLRYDEEEVQVLSLPPILHNEVHEVIGEFGTLLQADPLVIPEYLIDECHLT